MKKNYRKPRVLIVAVEMAQHLNQSSIPHDQQNSLPFNNDPGNEITDPGLIH
jgi:hypothetical protein